MEIIKNSIRTLGGNQKQNTQSTCIRLLKNDEIVNFTQVLQYFFDVDFCIFGGTSKSVKFSKRYAHNENRAHWRSQLGGHIALHEGVVLLYLRRPTFPV